MRHLLALSALVPVIAILPAMAQTLPPVVVASSSLTSQPFHDQLVEGWHVRGTGSSAEGTALCAAERPAAGGRRFALTVRVTSSPADPTASQVVHHLRYAGTGPRPSEVTLSLGDDRRERLSNDGTEAERRLSVSERSVDFRRRLAAAALANRPLTLTEPGDLVAIPDLVLNVPLDGYDAAMRSLDLCVPAARVVSAGITAGVVAVLPPPGQLTPPVQVTVERPAAPVPAETMPDAPAPGVPTATTPAEITPDPMRFHLITSGLWTVEGRREGNGAVCRMMRRTEVRTGFVLTTTLMGHTPDGGLATSFGYEADTTYRPDLVVTAFDDGQPAMRFENRVVQGERGFLVPTAQEAVFFRRMLRAQTDGKTMRLTDLPEARGSLSVLVQMSGLRLAMADRDECVRKGFEALAEVVAPVPAVVPAPVVPPSARPTATVPSATVVPPTSLAPLPPGTPAPAVAPFRRPRVVAGWTVTGARMGDGEMRCVMTRTDAGGRALRVSASVRPDSTAVVARMSYASALRPTPDAATMQLPGGEAFGMVVTPSDAPGEISADLSEARAADLLRRMVDTSRSSLSIAVRRNDVTVETAVVPLSGFAAALAERDACMNQARAQIALPRTSVR